jgi:hypothetical protein
MIFPRFQIRPDPFLQKYIRGVSRRSLVRSYQNPKFRRTGTQVMKRLDDPGLRKMAHPAWPCIRASWPCRGEWSGGTCAPSSADGTASTCNTNNHINVSAPIYLDILLRLGRKLSTGENKCNTRHL